MIHFALLLIIGLTHAKIVKPSTPNTNFIQNGHPKRGTNHMFFAPRAGAMPKTFKLTEKRKKLIDKRKKAHAKHKPKK